MLTIPLPLEHDLHLRRGSRGGVRTRARSAWRVLAMAATATLHVLVLGTLLLPDAHAPVRPREQSAVLADDPTWVVSLNEAAPTPPPPQPAPPPAARLWVAEPAATSLVPAPPPPAVDVVVPDSSIPSPAPVSAATPPAPVEPVAVAAPVSQSAPARTAPPDKASAQAYMRLLTAALLQHRRYPGEARKQRWQGVVAVRFTLDRAGHVLSMSVARSSGHPALDQAALEVLRLADPLPAIPSEFGKDRLTVTVPIEYSLITR